MTTISFWILTNVKKVLSEIDRHFPIMAKYYGTAGTKRCIASFGMPDAAFELV